MIENVQWISTEIIAKLFIFKNNNKGIQRRLIGLNVNWSKQIARISNWRRTAGAPVMAKIRCDYSCHPFLVPTLFISPVLKLCLTLALLPKNFSPVTVPCKFPLESLCCHCWHAVPGSTWLPSNQTEENSPLQLYIKAYCLDHKVHLKSVHSAALSHVQRYTEHPRMLPTSVVSYRSPCQPLFTQWCGLLGSAHVIWADRSLHIKMTHFPIVYLHVSV